MEDLSDFRWEPGENDTMYAGYSMLYDTQEERFVGDLRGDKTTLYSFVGENILLVSTDWGTPDRLYRPDGSLVAEMDYADADGRFFRFRVDSRIIRASRRLERRRNEILNLFGANIVFLEINRHFDHRFKRRTGESRNQVGNAVLFFARLGGRRLE